MINEVCRVVSDWLNDPVQGVNVLLPLTPLDAGDTMPPLLLSILDPRDGDVARGRLPKNLPGIAVVPIVADGLAPHITIADAEGDVHLAIRVGMTSAQTDEGYTDTSYYLRTIMRSLRRLNGNFDRTKLVRNGVYLEGASDVHMAQLFTPVGDSIITGAVLITYHVRELNAT